MKSVKRAGMFLGALVSIIVVGFSCAMAQSGYPNRSIEIVIPLSPGGGADISFTPFKDRVGKILGQPLVVSYKPGSAGATGTAHVAKAKPDGYTLLFGNKGGVVYAPLTKKGLGYTMDDLAPICLITRTPSLYYVKYDSPYKTLMDWMQAAKTKKMTYATHGAFSPPHISMEYLGKAVGFQATHVPYAGAADANVAALGGHVDMSCVTSNVQMVGPGKLRAIAVSSDARWELYPDTPTLVELGYPVFKGDPVGSAYWLWAPKAVPKEVINKVYAAFKKVNDERGAEIAKQLKSLELLLNFQGPDDLLKAAQNEYNLAKKVLEELGALGK